LQILVGGRLALSSSQVFKEEHPMQLFARYRNATALVFVAIFALFAVRSRAEVPPESEPSEQDTIKIATDQDGSQTPTPSDALESEFRKPLVERGGVAFNSSVFAKAFSDPAPHAADKVGAAEFNGVKPGATMSDELEKQWGVGKEISRDGDQTVLSYVLADFPRVDVTLDKNVVTSVIVHLQTPMPAAALAEKLEVNDVRHVLVPDDAGAILGQLYPEHGVLFNFAADGKRVVQVAIEQIDLEAFVLRAESSLEARCRDSMADITYVLKRQPEHARASWLRAKLLSQFARYDEAIVAIQTALAAEPKNAEYRLTLAEVVGARGKYDEAADEIKDVLSAGDLPGELKAQGLCLLGDLLAASPAHDYKQAMEHHRSAIQTADPLSISEHVAIRRAAKRVLFHAHLGMAHDIAAGTFQQKERVVPKWLSRASAYVQDMVEAEDGDPDLRLQLAKGALAACVATQGKVDAKPWMKAAMQTGKELIAKSSDAWRKSHLEWELGLILYDGLIVDEDRGSSQDLLANCTMTATYLESGAKDRSETADDVFRLGRLYYRIGSLHAVKRGDHKTAVAWYEKAVPLLDRPLPAACRNEQGKYGEWYVSMGISYWEIGQGDFAVQLTDAGLKHVEEAVARQLIDRKALAVPYSNLAAMHEKLGHQNEAKNFAELAEKSDGTMRR
jgi:tetratricopeptide (TPR) repeat protein